MWSQLDYEWFQAINHLAASVSVLNPLMRFLAQEGEYVFYFGVAVYWFIRTQANRRMVAEALLSACIALSASGVIGHFLYRNRPFVAHSVLQLIPHAANASFPSDHALGAFVIATTVWLFRKRDGKLWLLLAAGIAFSRIWTGVHYPSDVIAGALIGIAAAAFVHQLFARWLPAQRGLQAVIHLYEGIEHKIWPKHVHQHNL